LRCRGRTRPCEVIEMRRGLVLAIVGCTACAFAIVIWFWPHPSLIAARIAMFGAVPTYRSLSGHEARWAAVVNGVRAGRPEWLTIAVDLRSALDTHPGEEMLEAVADAFDANPDAAIRILVPAYGPETVCAPLGGHEPATVSHARARLERLRSSTAANEHAALACAGALSRFVSDDFKRP